MADDSLSRNGSGSQHEEASIEGGVMTVTIDERGAEALRYQAADRVKNGAYDEGLEILAYAQRMNPFSIGVHYDIAIAYYFKEDYGETLERLDITKMLEMSLPWQIQVWHLRGDAFLRLGRASEALGAFEETLRLGPEAQFLPYLLRMRAVLLAELGKAAEALDACDAALSLSPGDSVVADLRARLSP